MEEKKKIIYKIISIIFLITIIGSFLYACIREINYLKNKSDIENKTKIQEKQCEVINKKSERGAFTDTDYVYEYYLFIKCDEVYNNVKIKILSDDYYSENYLIGNSYTFYTTNGEKFYTTKEKLLDKYNPLVYFVIPFILFLLYLIYLESTKQFVIKLEKVNYHKKINNNINNNINNSINNNMYNSRIIEKDKKEIPLYEVVKAKRRKKYLILIIIFLLLLIFSVFLYVYRENNYDESKIIKGECRVIDIREDHDGSYDLVVYPVEVIKIKNDLIKLTSEESKKYKIGEIYEFYTLDHKSYYVNKQDIIDGEVGGYALLGIIEFCFIIRFLYKYKKNK